MTKKLSYAAQLKNKKWFDKRAEIIKRDFGCCRACGSQVNLQVHHTLYISGLLAWQTPDLYLVTLCKSCHEFEHKNIDKESLYVKRGSARFQEIAKQFPHINRLNCNKKPKVAKPISLAQKVANNKKKKSPK